MVALGIEGWSSLAYSSAYVSPVGIRVEEKCREEEEEVIPTLRANSTALDSSASTLTTGVLSIGFFLALYFLSLRNLALILQMSVDAVGVTSSSVFLFLGTPTLT